MTTTTTPIKDLYKRLRVAGFTAPYLRDTVLPEWWDDDAASTDAGFAEAAMVISRSLGFYFRSVRTPGAPLAPLASNVRFKKRKDTSEADLATTQRIAVQVAKMIALGLPDARPLPGSAEEIRNQILAEGAPDISLASLTDWCWAAGVAVVHLSRFPRGTARMDGFAVRVGERPIIVIASNRASTSWLSFIVAHELGHLALQHVANDSAVFDEEVTDDEEGSDEEEIAANRFAAHLLTGAADRRFTTSGAWPNAESLAKGAASVGKTMRVDPGHIVLNYAHHMGGNFYPVANAALKILGLNTGGPEFLRAKFGAVFDFSLLPADTSEFVMRMTQVGADETA